MFWRLFFLVALVFAGTISPLGAQNLSTIVIPIADLRKQLPEGRPVVIKTWVKDRWPHNDEDFFRHETLEIALGHKIRAKLNDRKHEGHFGEGVMVGSNNNLLVQGGWRLHKHVPNHNDFFDGVFRFNLALVVSADGLTPQISNLDIQWNKSLAAKLLKNDDDIKKMLRELAVHVEESVNSSIKDRLRQLETTRPEIRLLRKGAVVTIQGDSIHIAMIAP